MVQDENRDGRGFAGMDEEKRREIASKGGKAAHQSGSAHEWTPEEAREAGRKGVIRAVIVMAILAIGGI